MSQKAGIAPRKYEDVDAYMKARETLKQDELAMCLDAGIDLTPAEKEADRRLMLLKQEEIQRTRGCFPAAQNFLKSKTRQLIDQSPILEIMKRMPKGGILHAHGRAMGDYRWLVKKATYLQNCYIFLGQEASSRKGAMRISPVSPGDGWQLISELRKAAGNVAEFDEELYRSITLGEEDLGQADIWGEFITCFVRSKGLFSNEISDGFSRKLLKDIIAENVQYIETRGDIASQEIIEEIERDHPEFKVRQIFSAARSDSRERLADRLARAVDMRAENPSYWIGFDLVEEEDENRTNLYFINAWLSEYKL